MTPQNAIPENGFVSFDLNSEIAALESRKPWQQNMSSVMLLKSEDLRVLLIAMEAKARMKEHHSDGRISIHLLRGGIRVHVGAKVTNLSANQLLAIERSVKHEVEALEASSFLLTIAWPSEEDLMRLKHRGYGS